MKRFALAILALAFITVAGASATINDFRAGYRLDNVSDVNATFTLTNPGNSSFSTGLIGNALYSNGGGLFRNGNNTALPINYTQSATAWTISGWAWMNTSNTVQNIFGFQTQSGSSQRRNFYLSKVANNSVSVAVFDGRSLVYNTTQTINANQWYHYVLSYNGTTITVFVNGVNVLNGSLSVSFQADTGAGSFDVGVNRQGGAVGFNGLIGQMDAIYVWNVVLSQNQINCLYNGGLGRENPFDCALFINSADAYNGTILTSFNASVQWNGSTINYSTTNGTIITTAFVNSTLPANITFTPSQTNYFAIPQTFTNYNTHNLQANATPFTLVRAFALNGTAINNFSVNYTNYANLSESGIVITTNGIAFVPLFNATYNVTVFDARQGAINYARESRNVIANPYDQAENFTLFLTNTVILSVYNELNNIIINTTNNPNASTINIFLTGTIASYNYTTTNGSINASLILPDNYVVTFGGTGWTQRQTLFNLVNQSLNQINLFLIPSNTAYTLETFFQNQNFQPVAGANVTLLKKNLSGTNYYTVYGCTADAGGRCVMSVDIPSTTYRISYSFGSFTGSSGDLQFTLNDVTTGRTFFINTVNNTLAPVFQWNNIGQTTAINFLRTNNTYNGVVRLTLNNPSLLATQACMNVYAVVGNTRNLVNSSCTPASSVVSLDVGALPSGADSLYAQAYVTIGGVDFIIAQNSLQTNTGNISQSGRRLTLWAVVIGVALTMVLMFTWNPIAPPFIIGIVLYVFASVGLLYIPLGVVVSLIIMPFIMVLVIGKKT